MAVTGPSSGSQVTSTHTRRVPSGSDFLFVSVPPFSVSPHLIRSVCVGFTLNLRHVSALTSLPFSAEFRLTSG